MTAPGPGLVRAVDRFAGTRVVVLGDAMLDSYLHGVPRALCREAPVPILDIAFREDTPGGAANTALNLAALGADVSLIALLGADEEGELVRTALERDGVDTSMLVVDEGRRTLLKQRVLASDQMLARCDMGTTRPAGAQSLDAIRRRLRSSTLDAEAIVVSDYGYGVASEPILVDLEERGGRDPTLLVVDAKDLAPYRRAQPTAITPNYGEAVRALGLAEIAPGDRRLEQILARGPDLLELAGAHIAAVTLDADGAISFECDAPPYRSYSDPRPSRRTAGAGDTFLAAMALGLAAGLDAPRAVDVASAAAAVVVEKDGTGTCSAGELRVRLTATEKVVPDADALADRIDLARARGAKVVFTNGCFDILHRGHITYLSQAKELGDLLVVGLNSDNGVRRLKGAGRPINRQDDRAEVLAALSCVDLIVPFDEDTPIELLRRLRPETYVKGGDYTVESLPEAPVVRELGGEVRLLPYVAQRSTTGIIDRIRAASASDRPGSSPGSAA